jgi:predicted RNA-binding Zn-ribbon protein involved in translation (DUF1610 family)
MNQSKPRGLIYRCPICGAEVAVVASRMGSFVPRCCDVEMVSQRRRLIFYVCPVCGAEIAVLGQGAGQFVPRCCDVEMLLEAA